MDQYSKNIRNHLKNLRNCGLVGKPLYDFKNKEQVLDDLIDENLLKLLSMFDYKGLPDNFNKNNIELYLLTFGFCAIIEHEGKLWPMFGGLTGVQNSPLYEPTQITIANPALNISKTYTDGVDCVIIRNDTFYNGVLDILKRYCTLIVESNLSLAMWSNFGSRLTAAISAQDANTKASAEDFIKSIIDGDYSAILEDDWYDGVKVNPLLNTGNNGGILPLLEMLQYIDAELNKKFGLSSNNNRKRETLNDQELQADDAVLLPLLDNFLFYRNEGIQKVNDLFGVDWNVQKGSSWEIIEEEMELSIENAENDEQNEEIDQEDEEINEKEEKEDETDS